MTSRIARAGSTAVIAATCCERGIAIAPAPAPISRTRASGVIGRAEVTQAMRSQSSPVEEAERLFALRVLSQKSEHPLFRFSLVLVSIRERQTSFQSTRFWAVIYPVMGALLPKGYARSPGMLEVDESHAGIGRDQADTHPLADLETLLAGDDFSLDREVDQPDIRPLL